MGDHRAMGIDIIQADYDKLEAIADRFSETERTADVQSRLKQSVHALQNGRWEGEGSTAFFTEMERGIFPAMIRLTGALEQAQSVTLQVKDILQAAEEEAAGKFRPQVKVTFQIKLNIPNIGELFDDLIDETQEFIDDVEAEIGKVIDFFKDSAATIGESLENAIDGAVVELFKAGYDHEIPKFLIDQYATGNGTPVKLDESQMKELGVNANITNSQGFNDRIQEIANQGGGTQSVSFSSLAGAGTHGTLGTFTINYNGDLTVNVDAQGNITNWSFDGTMDFQDRWDFNPEPWGTRTQYGEVLTRIGDRFLPGEAFDITSDSIAVSQNNTSVEVVWSGSDIAGTPSRLANEMGARNNE